jgi:pantothenate kinase
MYKILLILPTHDFEQIVTWLNNHVNACMRSCTYMAVGKTWCAYHWISLKYDPIYNRHHVVGMCESTNIEVLTQFQLTWCGS